MTKEKATLNPDFLALKANLSDWRALNKGHRIPDHLWNEAIRLTHQFGQQQVIRHLGLSPQSFKRRIEKASAQIPNKARMRFIKQPQFLEIPLNAVPATPSSPDNAESRFLLKIRSIWGLLKIELS